MSQDTFFAVKVVGWNVSEATTIDRKYRSSTCFDNISCFNMTQHLFLLFLAVFMSFDSIQVKEREPGGGDNEHWRRREVDNSINNRWARDTKWLHFASPPFLQFSISPLLLVFSPLPHSDIFHTQGDGMKYWICAVIGNHVRENMLPFLLFGLEIWYFFIILLYATGFFSMPRMELCVLWIVHMRLEREDTRCRVSNQSNVNAINSSAVKRHTEKFVDSCLPAFFTERDNTQNTRRTSTHKSYGNSREPARKSLVSLPTQHVKSRFCWLIDLLGEQGKVEEKKHRNSISVDFIVGWGGIRAR